MILIQSALNCLYNLKYLELWLVRYEPISMTNIFIRCSSAGLFAAGVKKIRRVYCIGSLQYFLQSLFFEQSFSHLYNLINLELCLVRYEPISMTNTFIRELFSQLICRRRKKNKMGVLRRVFAIVFAKSFF